MLREHYIIGGRDGSKQVGFTLGFASLTNSAAGLLFEVGGREVQMTGWAERLLLEMDDRDETAKRLLAGLRVEQLNWRPGPGMWSVGQCVDHLCAMNDVYLPPIAKALEGKQKASVAEITPGWFARWFLNSFVEPSPETKKVKAPGKSAPASEVDGRLLQRLLKGNEGLRELIRRASEYDVNRIRFRNPFIPVIRFTVGTGLTIVVRHQHRHLLQAERVRAAEGFSAQ